MASENAKAVAQEVLETIRKGKKVDKGKIIRKHGYSDSISKAPTKVTETQSYKDVVSPVAVKMEKERDRIVVALSNKDLDKEKYRDMIDGLDKLTKNIQLLTGGSTENNNFTIGWQ